MEKLLLDLFGTTDVKTLRRWFREFRSDCKKASRKKGFDDRTLLRADAAALLNERINPKGESDGTR